MSKALDYLGIARMSGNIEIGEENAKALIKSGKARLMIVAQDTSDHAKKRAEGYVFEIGTPLIVVPFTKQDISLAVGKAGCSMAAFRDLGLATCFVQALAAENGETYGVLADELNAKLKKQKSRKCAGRKSGNRRKSE